MQKKNNSQEGEKQLEKFNNFINHEIKVEATL